MQVLSDQVGRPGAESLVQRLLRQLRRHTVLDSLLLCAPPAIVGFSIVALLYKARWLAPRPAVAAVLGILVFTGLALVLRLRPGRPSIRAAARLADRQSGARDHFLTLATIDAARYPPPLVARLRHQTEALGRRVDVGRDFPYRFKRAAFWSWGVSLLAGLLIYFFLPVSPGAMYRPTAQQRLAELIQRLAAQPTLRDLAQRLDELAGRLDKPGTPPAEKHDAINEMKKRIEEQRAKQQQSEHRDLLGQTAAAVDGLEQEQQMAGGQGPQQQEAGGGGIQTNAPQRGGGEGNQKQSGGEGQGESAAQPGEQRMEQGKTAQANPKDAGSGKSQAGDAKGDQKQPDPNQPGKEPSREKAEKHSGDSREGAGKQKATEEPPPQGGPQADRFYKPGEGKEGLAGKKGYVTVQLPEEVVADSKGQSAASKEPGPGRGRAKVPVSNVPLPPHIPNAPTEKQHVPLEYRGILR